VTITGSPRVLAWDNGWGYWQKSWSAWLKGSSAGPVTTTARTQARPRIGSTAGPASPVVTPTAATSPAASSPGPTPTTAG
jgi:hypothetical protein